MLLTSLDVVAIVADDSSSQCSKKVDYIFFETVHINGLWCKVIG